jgi:molecular chaperone DnaJ
MVETPVKLTEEQKDLVRQFDAALHGSDRDHRPREKTWLDGVKRFFENLAR